mmetsp:Transcript_119950/g.334621  ORF Transcript_119950/g.334621 Transcript_119950/m.334621 type:complete len:205 (-) Transcript_119950:229-843(-)
MCRNAANAEVLWCAVLGFERHSISLERSGFSVHGHARWGRGPDSLLHQIAECLPVNVHLHLAMRDPGLAQLEHGGHNCGAVQRAPPGCHAAHGRWQGHALRRFLAPSRLWFREAGGADDPAGGVEDRGKCEGRLSLSGSGAVSPGEPHGARTRVAAGALRADERLGDPCAVLRCDELLQRLPDGVDLSDPQSLSRTAVPHGQAA